MYIDRQINSLRINEGTEIINNRLYPNIRIKNPDERMKILNDNI